MKKLYITFLLLIFLIPMPTLSDKIYETGIILDQPYEFHVYNNSTYIRGGSVFNTSLSFIEGDITVIPDYTFNVDSNDPLRDVSDPSTSISNDIIVGDRNLTLQYKLNSYFTRVDGVYEEMFYGVALSEPYLPFFMHNNAQKYQEDLDEMLQINNYYFDYRYNLTSNNQMNSNITGSISNDIFEMSIKESFYLDETEELDRQELRFEYQFMIDVETGLVLNFFSYLYYEIFNDILIEAVTDIIYLEEKDDDDNDDQIQSILSEVNYGSLSTIIAIFILPIIFNKFMIKDTH